MQATNDHYSKPTWAFALAGIVATLALFAVIGFVVFRVKSPVTTNPTTQAAGVSGSKLGIFVQGINGDATKILNAGPGVVKILVPPNDFYRDESVYNTYMTFVKNYKTKYPTGKVLVRFYFDEMGQTDLTPSIGADDAAEIVFEQYEPILKKMRDKGDMKYFDYIAGPTNETERVPFWSKSDDDMYWLARFWDTLTKLNSYAGIKTCAGNILTGDIPLSDEAIKTLKAGLVPTLNSTGGVFCYHGYSDEGFTKTYESQKEQSLAFRTFYQKLGSGAPKMIIGELGIAGGWKVGTPAQYQDWLTWYDSEIKKDAQIIGATIYEVGVGGADQIDGPVATWLVGYLGGQGGAPTPVPSGGSNNQSNQACFDNCFKNIKPGNGSYCRTYCANNNTPNTTGDGACVNTCANTAEHFGNYSYCTSCCGGSSCKYANGNGGGGAITVTVKNADGTNVTSGTVRMFGTTACRSCNSACKDPVCNPGREKPVTNGTASWADSTGFATYKFGLVGTNWSCGAGAGQSSCTIVIGGGNSCSADVPCPTGQACVAGQCSNNNGGGDGNATVSGQVNACWGNPTGLGGKCYDCNGDGTINILDFTCFAKHWLENIM